MSEQRTIDGVADQEEQNYLAEWMLRLIQKSVLRVGGCWTWTGSVNHKGYGSTSWHGLNVAIHRKVFEITHGVLLTEEQFACHTCDTRACWNPAHLFLGDAKANNNDCARKERHHNTVKTHCKYGHPFNDANTVLHTLSTGSTVRKCMACEKIRMRTEKYREWRRQYQRKRRAKLREALHG